MGEGHQLAFSGSINETAGGWVNNRESFHVHCSWEGERERRHVRIETLKQLLDLLPRLGKPATLPPNHFAGSKLRLLA